MSGQSITATAPVSQKKMFVRTLLRGTGQVMFQESAWTGLLILAGIFWGAYESHTPQVAWGAVVALICSTLTGYILHEPDADGDAGLWGFNGILVGCALPTFLANTWEMWALIVVFSAVTTWVRTGYNQVMKPWKVNSLTFPFVSMTWIVLFASRIMGGLPTFSGGLSDPALPATAAATALPDVSFVSLVEYWLKGISQVFLINSWVTGALFLIGLAICSRWAAFWAAAGSAIALAVALLFRAPAADITSGLFGFSPVLTGIALGMTFYRPNIKSAIWTVIGIVATVFVQAAMDVMFAPWGLPTLTGPFCLTTWLFLLPLYKFDDNDPDNSEWHKMEKRVADDIKKAL